MGKKKPKKVSKDGEKTGQQDGSTSCGTSAGGRKAKKGKEKDLIDFSVKDLLLNIAECDNTDVPRKERFQTVVLVEYLQKNVESMYPKIGEDTYRVPDVHINKGREGEVNEDGVSEVVQPADTDVRSDRAHSFVSDMVYHLSMWMKKTKVGPFFIISSYEYDHFLSRLKTSFDEKLYPHDVDINYPNGSGHDRGEIDILIVVPKHVIFMEIKAIGDNFGDYDGDKLVPIRENIKKATKQLIRDEKVFDHVMADLNLQGFRRTKIAALPNLERHCLKEAMKADELKEMSQMFKFLCKEDMPENRLDFQKDFHVFHKWWINNVFPEVNEELLTAPRQHSSSVQNETNQLSPLDEVKVIVGRYIGFMSVVKVCNNSNSKLHRIEGKMEGRRKGQLVWYVGERFANIVLTLDQKAYLDANIRLGYLCGPPGSGKTVVLSLRARRWILNDKNFVIVVNMYRGAPGRAIGKQIYKTITENSDKNKEKFLKDHTMEIGVDVCDNRFNREEFIQKIMARWTDEIGNSGQRIMFIVDETYVQSYWNTVFQALRHEFANSAMWCAGLYGKQPDEFTSLELTKVIRCPPNVQRILSLIDWVDDRKKCYITDSTTASLPTNGPHVLTIRHKEHMEYTNQPPSQCRMCGSDLVNLFRSLHVRKPGKCHLEPDLKLWSLQCPDIIILVNLPRTLYSPDSGGYLDTTVTKYRSYMMDLKDCPMLKRLNEAGYPTRVHTDLSCSDLVSANVQEVINVTWIYTYQGLENKIIIFLPGDEAMPEHTTEKFLTEAALNIPCPGLLGSEDQEWQENKSQMEAAEMISRESSRGSSECEVGSGEETGESTDSDNSDIHECDRKRKLTQDSGQEKSCDHNWCLCGVDEPSQGKDEPSQGKDESAGTTIQQPECDTSSEPQAKSLQQQIFNNTDVNNYTRWDKSNLFISASRCTSQLILITR